MPYAAINIQQPAVQLAKCQGTPALPYRCIVTVGIYSAFVSVLSAVVRYRRRHWCPLCFQDTFIIQLLVSVVGATMQWHDTMPQGILCIINSTTGLITA